MRENIALLWAYLLILQTGDSHALHRYSSMTCLSVAGSEYTASVWRNGELIAYILRTVFILLYAFYFCNTPSRILYFKQNFLSWLFTCLLNLTPEITLVDASRGPRLCAGFRQLCRGVRSGGSGGPEPGGGDTSPSGVSFPPYQSIKHFAPRIPPIINFMTWGDLMYGGKRIYRTTLTPLHLLPPPLIYHLC